MHMATKLVIVGGVAGGATAAARARRLDEQAEIIVFERGEHISFANCGLPYYIGQVIKKRDHLLVTTAEALRTRYNIDVRNFAEVTAIDRQNKKISVKNLQTAEQKDQRKKPSNR
jgi:NADPH-dependent 2,4-dienoyl-CoA reductase/sulfur reductase-like enzyme